jgi:hypothetical protein
MIKATPQKHGKPDTGQQQGDIRRSTLAPHSTVAIPTTRNACQGTNPPSRRPQSVLRGSSRGEEASKKLLAIRSVHNRQTPVASRHEENPACRSRCDARKALARKQRNPAHNSNTPHRHSSHVQQSKGFPSSRFTSRVRQRCSLAVRCYSGNRRVSAKFAAARAIACT